MPESLKDPCCPAPLFKKKKKRGAKGYGRGGRLWPGPHEPGQPRDPDQVLLPSQVCPAIGTRWDHSAGQVVLEGRGEVSVCLHGQLGDPGSQQHPLAERPPGDQGVWAAPLQALCPACPHHSAGTVSQQGWPQAVTQMLTWVEIAAPAPTG